MIIDQETLDTILTNIAARNKAPRLGDGAWLITFERERQKVQERYGPEHDAQHTGGELALAAACYVLDVAKPSPHLPIAEPSGCWPWPDGTWKPTPDDKIRQLQKAGALIAAEIDRLIMLRDDIDDQGRKKVSQ